MVPVWVFRTAFMNSSKPLTRSIIMDAVPQVGSRGAPGPSKRSPACLQLNEPSPLCPLHMHRRRGPSGTPWRA
jgi:hypothetical protein